ncbi:MAG TPA: outer membrane beta-barrel protein [Bacteroidota bacterium]|nr:outer membrane beta-barrel protein [Bacteroidota bacterium]
MKLFLQTIALAAVIVLLSAPASQAQFRNGGNWLGPNLTLATDPIGFGVSFEHGVSPNIGIGGIVRYWGKSVTSAGFDWSWSIIMPQLQGAYHFMPGDKLDPYAGGRLGYAIYSFSSDNSFFNSTDDGGLFLTAYGGLRYFFNPGVSINGNLEFRVAGEDYFGSTLQLAVGVDFTL